MLVESLVLAGLIFAIGTLGVIVRRNVIIMFLCIELQLNAVNLTFVAFSRYQGIEGQLFVFFVMTVAAAAPHNSRQIAFVVAPRSIA